MEDQSKQQRNNHMQTNSKPSLTTEQQVSIEKITKHLKDYGQIPRQNLINLIKLCQNILLNEPNVLRLSSPIKIVGDIHGQFHDLLQILGKYGKLPDDKFLFLGDYVDRGHFCIEVITLLIALKVQHPKNIFLLRGNHEGKTMTEYFNFKLQCIKKYDIQVYETFIEFFCKFPICAVVDNRYFCVHGGISPQFKKIKQLDSVNRFKQIQNSGLFCDLFWSDPVNASNPLWEKNKLRSCSYLFSRKQTQKFLQDNKIELIIRGHEVQTKGFAYQMSEMRQKLTLTVFSAPNYCDTYKNKGAISVIEKGSLSITSFSQTPHPFVFSNYMNVMQWSIPLIATQTSQLFLHLISTLDKEQKQLSVDQVNAFNKLRALSNILQSKKTSNFQLLITPDKLEGKEGSQQFQSLFSAKKGNDQSERYPVQVPQVIGPKHLEFDKVHFQSQKEEQGIQPLSNFDEQT